MTMGPWIIEETKDENGVVVQRRIFTAWEHGQLKGPAPVVTGMVTIAKIPGHTSPYHGVHIDADDAELIRSAPELKAERDSLLLQNEALKNEVEFLSKNRAENITLRLDIDAVKKERDVAVGDGCTLSKALVDVRVELFDLKRSYRELQEENEQMRGTLHFTKTENEKRLELQLRDYENALKAIAGSFGPPERTAKEVLEMYTEKPKQECTHQWRPVDPDSAKAVRSKCWLCDAISPKTVEEQTLKRNDEVISLPPVQVSVPLAHQWWCDRHSLLVPSNERCPKCGMP